jgi:hypothetical protein
MDPIVTQKTALIFRDNYVTITPTHEMGGGIEGYIVQDRFGGMIASFEKPYCPTPEKEWEALSDLGKDRVRVEGWTGLGDETHAVAAALRALGVTPNSSELREYLEENEVKLAKFEADARAELDDLLDPSKSDHFTHNLFQYVDSFRQLSAIVAVAKELERYTEDYSRTWAYWPIPSTNH